MSTKDDSQTGTDSSQKEGTRTRKMMSISVLFLDNSVFTFEMPSKALGRTLFDKVCKMLNLVETDYFGLEYEDESKAKYWLDGLKPLCRQVGLTTTSPTFSFCVKFYTPDPVQLEDEFTRYLFSLQLKKDIAGGTLQCNDNTAVVLISYIVQAELGDFDASEFPDYTYLSKFKFVPFQDADLEKKIMESHKKHVGQTPAEAELNLLETARRCELYGVRMNAAKDQEGVPLNLAVAHLGVLVFQNYTKINTFSWAKIRKLSFKRKKFLIKLHPEGYGYYKDTAEYFFEGRNDCKNFWKKCIENHTFFRCTDATKGMRQKTKLFSRGSSFRYSGRTQVQLSEYVRGNYVKRNFQRSTSLRTTPNSPSKSSSGHISPQPLLPVSSSFESMAVNSAKPPSSPLLKKLSSSEPATPHVVQEVVEAVTNGNGVSPKDEESQQHQDLSPGLTTPDSELGGYQTPDFMGQETDDNISHDSYHIADKEIITVEPEIHNSKLNGEDDSPTVDAVPAEEQFTNNKIFISSTSFDPSTGIATENPTVIVTKKEISNGSEHSPDAIMNGTYHNGHISDDFLKDTNGQDSKYIESPTELSPDSDISSGNDESFNSLFGSPLHNTRKTPTDKAYFSAKDLLMSERTYRRDLEIIDVVFREHYSRRHSIRNDAVDSLLAAVAPLYDVHCLLLRDLEQRLAFWEGRHITVIKNGIKGVGDIFVNYIHLSKLYKDYIGQLENILKQLNSVLKTNETFGNFYQQFEAVSVCYLPLTSLLIRPLYRLSYYCSIFRALLEHYGKLHIDYDDTQAMLNEFHNTFADIEYKLPLILNYVKIMELERNIVAFPVEKITTETVFVREGCLQNFTTADSHQCMVFLFSNMLLCAKQIILGKLQFKVDSIFPTSHLEVSEVEPHNGSNYCFTVRQDNDCLYLAAGNEKERAKWMEDIISTMNHGDSSSSQVAKDEPSDGESMLLSHHVNTSVHVCWHRNISIGKADLIISVQQSLSGFMLRKFRNNSGWQKLWVVLSNLCLFFFKSYLDECPLASLPLPGYRILLPTEDDSVTKDCVFKLQYKNYEYFFRAESKFLFSRWMEAIQLSTLANEEKTRL